MTSFRQIEANRRNALSSTGPKTENGKRRSRHNTVRHGLTAETVVVALEDIRDYRAFEAAVIADYDARTAVERELVLRLASLLWRSRRATAIEADLLQIQAEILHDRRYTLDTASEAAAIVYRVIGTALRPNKSKDVDPGHDDQEHLFYLLRRKLLQSLRPDEAHAHKGLLAVRAKEVLQLVHAFGGAKSISATAAARPLP